MIFTSYINGNINRNISAARIVLERSDSLTLIDCDALNLSFSSDARIALEVCFKAKRGPSATSALNVRFLSKAYTDGLLTQPKDGPCLSAFNFFCSYSLVAFTGLGQVGVALV